MFQLGLIDAIVAERKREVEAALRRRRLLQSEPGATEPEPASGPKPDTRAMTMRTRPTTG